MNGYQFVLTCPACGSPMEHVTSGRVIANRETSAIARCPTCPQRLAEWQVMVSLLPVATLGDHGGSRATEASCGTASGYRRHIRLGEPTCDECKRAHSLDERMNAERRRNRKVGVFV